MKYATIRLRKSTDKSPYPSAVLFHTTRPVSGGFHIRNIDGLGMPDINVNLTSAVDNRMAAYNGSRSQNRQIVITAAMYADYAGGKTIGDLRDSLYRLVGRIGDKGDYVFVDLHNSSGGVIRYTWGYISKIEAPQFSKDPLVQVTIECVPLHILGVTDQTPPIDTHWLDVDNSGTAPTGVNMAVRVGPESRPVLFVVHVDGKQAFKLYRDGYFVEGDLIRLDTSPDKRSITLTRDSVTTDLLKHVSGTSKWFEIPPGKTQLNVLGNTTPNPYKIESITTTRRYWGAS